MRFLPLDLPFLDRGAFAFPPKKDKICRASGFISRCSKKPMTLNRNHGFGFMAQSFRSFWQNGVDGCSSPSDKEPNILCAHRCTARLMRWAWFHAVSWTDPVFDPDEIVYFMDREVSHPHIIGHEPHRDDDRPECSSTATFWAATTEDTATVVAV